MSREQLINTGKHRLPVFGGAQGKIMSYGALIDLRFRAIGAGNRPGFGGDDQLGAIKSIEQGTVSQGIPSTDQAIAFFIENHQGKLADEVFKTKLTPESISMQHQGCIRDMTTLFYVDMETAQQFGTVIQSAIEHEPERHICQL
jgi:hypothetical protein